MDYKYAKNREKVMSMSERQLKTSFLFTVRVKKVTPRYRSIGHVNIHQEAI